MASLARIGIIRLASIKGVKGISAKTEINLARCISSKVTRSRDLDRPPKPKPWPYTEKPYNILNYWTDRTTSRFDENTKIIVVEGPVAAGKTQFAKALAEELDMVYFPEANLDMHYINPYGYDLKQLDEQLPISCKSFDIKNFLLTPKHENTAAFQIKQLSQYIDALAHLLNTGEGIVLDRCCYSDFVFLEAMYSQKYISKKAYKYYYEVYENTIIELLRPHLVIYLDTPVSKVQENIKKRALKCEMNSPVLTPQYLATMEKFYKQKYLKEMNVHSELLIYDWSDGGEVEVVVEDIERIDFDNYDSQDKKSKHWRGFNEQEWGALRNLYTVKKQEIMVYGNIPYIHVSELCVDPDDSKLFEEVLQTAPGERYGVGYNENLGDTGLLFRNKEPHRVTLPRRERVLE